MRAEGLESVDGLRIRAQGLRIRDWSSRIRVENAFWDVKLMVNPKKLETGLRTISAGIAYALLLGIDASGFPTFGLLL